MADTTQLYPLKFHERIRRYGFGGRRIPEYFGKDLPEGIVAETWEITEHGDDVSIVRDGPLAGRDLRSLIAEHGPRLLGRRVAATSPTRFPLLLKFLDAQKTLGMQVHPDDAYAAANEPGETGKTEAWYVVAADPGATLFCGNVPGLTKEELARAIADGSPERCMLEIAVQPGDTIYVPAGRMHAIGQGILVYEAQQSCDLTYGPRRWPRDDDETARRRVVKFVEACHLEALGEQRIPPVSIKQGKNERRFLLAGKYFAMERLTLGEPWHQSLDGEGFLAYSVLDGDGRIEHGGGSVSFRKGESVLIPASLGDYAIVPVGECQLIVAYVPDLLADVVAPLRSAGVAPEQIAGLGGPGAANDVRRLLS